MIRQLRSDGCVCNVRVNGFRLHRMVEKEEKSQTENTWASYSGTLDQLKKTKGGEETYQLHSWNGSVVGITLPIYKRWGVVDIKIHHCYKQFMNVKVSHASTNMYMAETVWWSIARLYKLEQLFKESCFFCICWDCIICCNRQNYFRECHRIS